MRVRIQRGAEEIGGNCVDVATAGGRRIVLDAGLPLPRDATEGPPPVGGFRTPVGSPPVAVVVSHPHLDHYGLVPEIAPGVPVYVGREAAALLSAAAFFSPSPEGFVPTGFLRHREPLAIGPFTVTPYLVDHSAFDAYSMLIEADGLRLFYTGDLRGHGRKRTLFTQLLDRPPTGVDVLLMEGTHVRADASADEVVFPTEDELEDRFVEAIRATRGAVVVLASMQNLDRLVTVYRAGRRCGRETVLDLYGAMVAAATRPTIPQPGFDHLRVYLSRRQRALVKRTGAFWRTDRIQPHRVFPEDLAADPGRYCLYMSCSTVRELVDVAALDGSGLAVWSMWPGYLSTPSGLVLQDLLQTRQIRLIQLHTSGHASVADLRRLVAAVAPARVVPIHSEAGDRYAELFPDVDRHVDGDWWEV